MNTTLIVQNLKCSGCSNTIIKNLESLNSISDIIVHKDSSEVRFSHPNEESLSLVKKKLLSLGYPTIDDSNGNLHKLKSIVSCAVGKMTMND